VVDHFGRYPVAVHVHQPRADVVMAGGRGVRAQLLDDGLAPGHVLDVGQHGEQRRGVAVRLVLADELVVFLEIPLRAVLAKVFFQARSHVRVRGHDD
jgi:hypothetical protein